jgi:hypothetical protein
MSSELETRFADVAVELGVVASRLGELVDVVSGDAVAIPLRVVLDATRNPYDWRGPGGTFHALKVDNPTANVVGLAFSSDNGSDFGSVDELIPAHMGRVITRPFETFSLGFAVGAIPAGVSTLYVTVYARQLNPASYAFV